MRLRLIITSILLGASFYATASTRNFDSFTKAAILTGIATLTLFIALFVIQKASRRRS